MSGRQGTGLSGDHWVWGGSCSSADVLSCEVWSKGLGEGSGWRLGACSGQSVPMWPAGPAQLED